MNDDEQIINPITGEPVDPQDVGYIYGKDSGYDSFNETPEYTPTSYDIYVENQKTKQKRKPLLKRIKDNIAYNRYMKARSQNKIIYDDMSAVFAPVEKSKTKQKDKVTKKNLKEEKAFEDAYILSALQHTYGYTPETLNAMEDYQRKALLENINSLQDKYQGLEVTYGTPITN